MCKKISVLMHAVATALAGCSEVVHPTPPEDLDDRLILFAVLDPDSTRHFVEVGAADGMTRWELTGLTVAIHKGRPRADGIDWTLVAARRAGTAATGDPRHNPCYHKPGIVALFRDQPTEGRRCLMPEAVLEPGALYKVEATADGRIPVSGTTRALGPFEIKTAVLAGSKGKHTVAASWTESAAAHRYMMALRRQDRYCANCIGAWYRDLPVTRYQGPVPQLAVDSAGASPWLDVAALDKHFHAFVTTGHQGNFGTVQPVQNVSGGFGVVGSVRYRSRKLDIDVPQGGLRPGAG